MHQPVPWEIGSRIKIDTKGVIEMFLRKISHARNASVVMDSVSDGKILCDEIPSSWRSTVGL